ncbi:protein lin-54 homolog [Actinia tenebrosa]|uniref:Protein lin-54 homolog n=1 Tax=Actinia tenebrosa TaxID=6105 RepID=A0A6P8IZZ7_ACTTE|nr:protein lin-54 homolog [Actinia tenebrosa]
MEKIITVKQEPVDDNVILQSFTIPSTNTDNTQLLVTTNQETARDKGGDVKGENVSSTGSVAITTNQVPGVPKTTAVPIPIVSTMNQPISPMVVISGSPVKLTQIRPSRSVVSGSTGQLSGVQLQGQGIKGNVRFFQVQNVNPTSKQPISVKLTGSPSKQGQTHQLQKVIPINLATTGNQVVTSSHITMATSGSGGATVRSIAPKMNIAPAPTISQTIQLAPKPQVTANLGQGQQQRFIIPAIAPNMSTGNNIQFPHGVISGGVVYLPQQAIASGGYPIAVPLSANAFPDNQTNTSMNGTSPESSPPTRPRKPCNCTKSQCLKLYCDCFAQGEFCSNCNCINCFNNMEHEKERSKAIKACLERNPHAFHPKIGKGKVGESERRHNKGCHCKRSGCLKNYCECYEAKILCTSLCKCTGCKNFEESPERKTLMHLADAAEVRVNQQNAAKTKLESQIEDLPTRPSIKTSSGERLPFSFVTNEVAQATCQCLVAQAAEAEKMGLSPAMTEKMILEEFGRSLLQIIHTASKTKAQH